jgi:hypothetical protein
MNNNNSRKGLLLLFTVIFSCASFLMTNTTTVKVKAQQDISERCVPLPATLDAPIEPANIDECTRPGTQSVPNSWPQNANVTVAVNASQFTQAEYDCMKSVFEDFNNAGAANGSNVHFNVSYSNTPVAILASPYVSGGPNTVRREPGIDFGLQVNAPTGMRPQALGEENIGTDNARRNSGVLHLNPNIASCELLKNILAHEIGHTFGLQDCCSCAAGTTIMNCGTCAVSGTNSSGQPVCTKADYNDASNGRSAPTSCDNESIKNAGQYPTPTPTPTLIPEPTPEPTATPPGGECEEYGAGWYPGNNGRTCVPPECADCYGNGGSYCSQTGACWTPVVIDLDGNGFNLTNASEGVLFAPDSSGQLLRTGWTAAHSDDAFLVLDRNGNALIDDGTELFGSASPQPAPPAGQLRHGFLALALYDRPAHGGNNDNRIDAGDSIFARLKLWQDRNHNGISEADELQALSASPVRIVELDYRESRRTDEHGNRFRYRAKVRDARGAQVGRWAWDVFPVSSP